MSWRFPPKRVWDLQVAGVDDVNEDVWEFVDGVNGNLGEHNWAVDAITTLANVEEDAVFRLYHAYEEVESGNPGASPTGTYTITNAGGGSWQRIGDMLIEFDGGGVLWITGSLAAARLDGVAFGIRLDGRVIPDSIQPARDSDQDRAEMALGGGVDDTDGFSPLFQGDALSVVLEVFAAVVPGPHTVELVVSGATAGKVFNREMYVLEARLAG